MRLSGILILFVLPILSGCIITDLHVSNPIPEMTRIAIVPFINLSSEREVDGRYFADLYFSELQKCPGFQVLPIGVTETAIREHQLNLERPAEILHLAEILDVDAVVFGAITEYSPYKPPRMGLQISWYASKEFLFSPGIPVDPTLRHQENKVWFDHHVIDRAKSWLPECDECHDNCPQGHPKGCHCQACLSAPRCEHCTAEAMEIRGQSSDGMMVNEPMANAPMMQGAMLSDPVLPDPVLLDPMLPHPMIADHVIPGEMTHDSHRGRLSNDLEYSLEPEPIMSYTRIFDSSDPDLTAVMRDYVELNGQLREGGFKGWTQRSDDFIRFCMHRVILEMFQLHGGEARRRYIISSRRFK